jgi:hypothetical protein
MLPRAEVEYILTECFIALGQSVREQTVSAGAARFWRDRYLERFLATLTSERPRTWERDRLNVLAKATALGRTAAALATEEGATVITERHAKQASEANDCRPRSRYGLFAIWCVPPGQRAEAPQSACRDRGWLGRVRHALGGA